MAHYTIGKDGIETIYYEKFKNVWVCSKCNGLTGYTNSIEKVIRHAFCQICDSETKQIVQNKNDKL